MGSDYQKKTALVTGGLGFIGSTLALKLANLGAEVVVVDSSAPGCGANPRNLHGAASAIRVIHADIAEAEDFASDIRRASVIFNLAGEISHINSMTDPLRDAELNALAQLHFLQACARHNPGVRVVYASTRQVYGAPRYLPVDENHPIQPVDFNGIHKYAATAYHQVATSTGQIDGRIVRLSNVYGPRMALNVPGQGFLGNFVRKALLSETIEIFGDGKQLRDPLFVDDAVDAFLLAGATDRPASRLWNVGGAEAPALADIARTIASAAGAPAPVFRAFPADLKKIDIGSYATDNRRIHNELGWYPQVSLADGIERTIGYFRRELPHYLDSAARKETSWSPAIHAPQPMIL